MSSVSMCVGCRRLVAAAGMAVSVLAAPAAGQVIDWAAAVDGNWNDAANWSPANVPNALGESAVLGLVGPYTVTFNGSFSFDSLTISNPEATLNQPPSTMTIQAGDIDNAGTIAVNPFQSNFNTLMQFSVDSMITGSGVITMLQNGDANDARISAGGGTLTHDVNHTIMGSGTITGPFVNDGLVAATDSDNILEIEGDFSQGASGELSADMGTVGFANGASVSGGTITTANDGLVLANSGTSSFGDLTNLGDMGVRSSSTLGISGDVTNDGTLIVNSNGSSFNAILNFNTNASLNGTGSVTLNETSGDPSDAQLNSSKGAVGTNGANHSIFGSGLINAAINNDGLIQANVDSKELRIQGSIAQSATGVAGATNNAVLGLGNGGSLTGGTVQTSAGGIVEASSGTSSVGGGIVNQGTMGVRSSTTMNIVDGGGIVNNGTLTLNSNATSFNAVLNFLENATIGGNGEVILTSPSGDLGDSQLNSSVDVTGTNGASHTISGTGVINATLINNGTISGNVDGSELRIQSEVTQGANGVIRGDDGGNAGLGNGASITGGFFDSSNGGSVRSSSGVSTIRGVTNLGQAGVGSSTTLQIASGGLTNDGTITMNDNGSSFNASISIIENATIDGAGMLVLTSPSGDLADSLLTSAEGVVGTNGVNHAIVGNGRVDAALHNDGIISGNVDGAELRIQGTVTQSATGVIRGDDGGTAGIANGASITGGFFDSSNSGSVQATQGTSTISGVTSLGDAGAFSSATMQIDAGGFTNDGTFRMNSNGSSFDARVTMIADAAIDGAGTFILTSPSGDLGDSQLETAAKITGTIGADQTVAGTGRMTGDWLMNGAISPGEPVGRIDLSGTHTQSDTSVTRIEIDTVDSFDTITGGAAIALDGTLEVIVDESVTFNACDIFEIISGSSITGEFDDVVVTGGPSALRIRVVYFSDRVELRATCIADANADCELNILDFVEFQGQFQAGEPLADCNEDGLLNILDFVCFQGEFQGPCGGG